MEPRRYTKEPVSTVKKTTRVGLFLFYQPNIIRSKLVTIGKLEPIGKVIIRRAMGVIQSLKSKLVKEDILMDAVYTLDSTLVFYYSTKLLELSLPSINIVYTQYLREKITFSKDALYPMQMNLLYYVSDKVIANLCY